MSSAISVANALIRMAGEKVSYFHLFLYVFRVFDLKTSSKLAFFIKYSVIS